MYMQQNISKYNTNKKTFQYKENILFIHGSY